MGLSRDTFRHESQVSALNVQLRDQITQTARRRWRWGWGWGWGYRMIHDVLRLQFPGINHKRVYRNYTAEGLLSTAIEYEYRFEEAATQYGYTRRISFLSGGPRAGRA